MESTKLLFIFETSSSLFSYQKLYSLPSFCPQCTHIFLSRGTMVGVIRCVRDMQVWGIHFRDDHDKFRYKIYIKLTNVTKENRTESLSSAKWKCRASSIQSLHSHSKYARLPHSLLSYDKINYGKIETLCAWRYTLPVFPLFFLRMIFPHQPKKRAKRKRKHLLVFDTFTSVSRLVCLLAAIYMQFNMNYIDYRIDIILFVVLLFLTVCIYAAAAVYYIKHTVECHSLDSGR